jgi:hypothetical protein
MRPAKADWKFRFDFRILSILLLISVVPFLLGAWWLINSYRESYLEAQGANLAEEAEMAFNYLDNYLENQIIKIAGLTEVPTLREAIDKSNLDLKTNTSEAQKRIAAIEARWRSLDYKSPELRAVLDNPASDFLRRYVTIASSYREIIVTDMMGRTVAATGKTSDFQHLKDAWWKEAYSDGQKGAIYIGDMHYHESAKTYCFDVAQPFVDPKGGVMGAIMVGVDAREIHAIIASLRTGFGGTAALIRTDGSVISAPGDGFLGKQLFPGAQEIIDAGKKGKRYIVTQTKPQTIFGMRAQSFMKAYPHLNWILVISSPVDTVVGPLSHLWRNVLTLMLAVVLVTVVTALWLSRTESRPVLEEDGHFEQL